MAIYDDLKENAKVIIQALCNEVRTHEALINFLEHQINKDPNKSFTDKVKRANSRKTRGGTP